MSYGIAIAIVLLLVLVLMGLLLLGIGLIMVVLRMRSRSAAAAPPQRASSPQRPRPPVVTQRTTSPSPAAPRPDPKPEAPPLASNSGLLGFFDDEAFVSPTASSAPREVEGAKTELFQRGKMAIDWDDDDSDEGEATEIFSAHGAAGDLAEFAFDDDDHTGRFT